MFGEWACNIGCFGLKKFILLLNSWSQKRNSTLTPQTQFCHIWTTNKWGPPLALTKHVWWLAIVGNPKGKTDTYSKSGCKWSAIELLNFAKVQKNCCRAATLRLRLWQPDEHSFWCSNFCWKFHASWWVTPGTLKSSCPHRRGISSFIRII